MRPRLLIHIVTADYLLYGMWARSEIALPGHPRLFDSERRKERAHWDRDHGFAPGDKVVSPCVVAGDAVVGPDVEIIRGPEIDPPGDRPPGTVLAYHALSPSQWYSFARLGSGEFLLRYSFICDFVVDSSLRRVEVRTATGADPDLVAVFATGAVPAFLLVMAGLPVLHASAVDLGGQAIAFVGRSGMGKSTMATLFCASSGRLVTDDVLRLTTGPRPRCYLGPSEVRLRGLADELTTGFADKPVLRPTGDGRSAAALARDATDLAPLAAIVVPLPSRTVSAPDIERLSPAEALVALLSFPRIVGWRDPGAQAQQFQRMADVAAEVPVFRARVPWGPPFPGDLASTLLAAMGIDARLPCQ